MAAAITLQATICMSHGPSLPLPKARVVRLQQFRCRVFGGNDGGDENPKFITRKQEPEEFWQSEAEREGKGIMSTPFPYIAILSILTPFIILAVALANGWIKTPVR